MRTLAVESRLLVSFVVAIAVAAAASPASAHTRSVSYSLWQLTDRGARVEVRVPAIELTRFEDGEPPPEYFSRNLVMRAGEEVCASSAVERTEHDAGWIVFRWTVECLQPAPRVITSRLFADVIASHTHFARVSTAEGKVWERFLVDGDPLWRLPETQELPPTKEAAVTIGRYVELGIRHIAGGWDHLAFLFALLLVSSSLAEVTLLVSAFTIAHSMTLALAVTGLVRPQAAAVETVIAFSIALVAAENAWLLAGRDRVIRAAAIGAALTGAAAAALWASSTLSSLAWLGLALFSYCHFGLLDFEARPARVRAAVAFAFGLVHGLGFAGVLMEMELHASQLLPALFGFNSGVEIGQLAIVAAVWPLLAALARRRLHWRRLVAELGSAAIVALGVFWVMVRGWPA